MKIIIFTIYLIVVSKMLHAYIYLRGSYLIEKGTCGHLSTQHEFRWLEKKTVILDRGMRQLHDNLSVILT